MRGPEPAEEVVDPVRFRGVAGMEHAEQVDEDAPLLEERRTPAPPAHAWPRRRRSFRKRVVQLRGPVQAQADGEALLRQETRPGPVQECSRSSAARSRPCAPAAGARAASGRSSGNSPGPGASALRRAIRSARRARGRRGASARCSVPARRSAGGPGPAAGPPPSRGSSSRRSAGCSAAPRAWP